MRVLILILCLFITYLQLYGFINQIEIEKRINDSIENQLKIINIISIDKVDIDLQIESIINKIKELETKNNNKIIKGD